MTPVAQILNSLKTSSPLPFNVKEEVPYWLDLSVDNPEAKDLDPSKPDLLQEFIDRKLEESGKPYAAGGYSEDRQIYRMSQVFDGENEEDEPRSIHLGIDLWLEAGTGVNAVLDGAIHSMANNDSFGDYGPTIILEHEIDGLRFYTLYGHLSRKSLKGKKPGSQISRGDNIGWLGKPKENVGWPPHLHFQVILDMMGKQGDFPGVCKPAEAYEWLARCPDPNLLLKIPH